MNNVSWIYDIIFSFCNHSFVVPVACMGLCWVLVVFLCHLFRGDL